MRFLYPIGGIDKRFGTLTSPSHKGIPGEIKNGKPWACDNEAFTKGYRPNELIDWLIELLPYRFRL